MGLVFVRVLDNMTKRQNCRRPTERVSVFAYTLSSVKEADNLLTDDKQKTECLGCTALCLVDYTF